MAASILEKKMRYAQTVTPQVIATANPGFGTGAIRQDRQNDNVAVALAECEAGIACARIADLLFVFLVLARRQVAGLRIKRLEQSVERARSHGTHVRVVHIILLNLLQHFPVDGQRLVGLIVRTPAEEDMAYPRKTKDQYRYGKNADA